MMHNPVWVALLPFVGLLSYSSTLTKFVDSDEWVDAQLDSKLIRSLHYRPLNP